MNATTGVFIWSYKTGAPIYSHPAIFDGKVYIGSEDTKVYCLDAATGTYIWSYKTGLFVSSGPAVVDGKVYVGSDDDKVYCLDAASGEYIWSYKTDSDVESSPAVANGKVYIGSCDGKVYCFGAPASSPNPTPMSTPTLTGAPMPTTTPTQTTTQTSTSSSSPTPTSSSMVSSSFWMENQLMVGLVVFVGALGVVVFIVSYRRLRASKRNLCGKLTAKGEDLVKKNELSAAVECFARASIAGFKTKAYDAATKALEQYTTTAKTLIIKSVLSGGKTEAVERVSKLQSEISKTISHRTMQSPIVGSILEGVSGLDLLLAKAGENDLDFVVDAALKTPEVEGVFLGALTGLDEVLIVDLAAKLGYSVDATFKLLSKGITLKKIEGYITSDGKKYVSKEYVQKQLSAHLK